MSYWSQRLRSFQLIKAAEVAGAMRTSRPKAKAH